MTVQEDFLANCKLLSAENKGSWNENVLAMMNTTVEGLTGSFMDVYKQWLIKNTGDITNLAINDLQKLFATQHGYSSWNAYDGSTIPRKVFNFSTGLPSGLIFSRLSDGTHFDELGILHTEKENKLLYSNDMSNAVWVESGGTTTIVSSATVDPIAGTQTTWLIGDPDGAFNSLGQTITVPDNSGQYTVSVYVLKDAQADDFPEFELKLTGGTQVRNSCQINKNLGTTNFRFNDSSATATVTDETLWWRFSFTITNNSTGNTSLTARVSPGLGNTGTLGQASGGSGIGTVGLFGWQLETSPLGDYARTTNNPSASSRLHHIYENGVWANQGLMVEAPATNLIPDSLDFDTTWTLNNGLTRALASGVTAPDGTVGTPWTITDPNTGSIAAQFYADTIANDSLPHTYSLFILKDNDETRFPSFGMSLTGGTGVFIGCKINTKTGELANTGDNTTIIDYGDWWRVSITTYNNSTGNTSISLNVYASLRETSLIGANENNATGSVTIWGAQWEKTSFRTSYMPTSGGTFTRAKDDVTVGPLELGSDLATNGDFEVDSDWSRSTTGDGFTLISGGVGVATVTSTGTATFEQAITTVVGKTYSVKMDNGATGDMFFQVGTSSGASDLESSNPGGTVTDYEALFTATTTTSYIQFKLSVPGALNIDNVTVFESTPFNGYSTTEGSLRISFDCIRPDTDISGDKSYIACLGDGTLNDGIEIYIDNLTGQVHTTGISNGVAQWNLTAPAVLLNNTKATVMVAYKLNDVRISVNGGAVQQDTSALMPRGVNLLRIGEDTVEDNQLNGRIVDVRYWNSARTDEELIRGSITV